MSLTEQFAYRGTGYAGFYTFPVVVSGGVGSFQFPTPISGKLYHRQVSPPNGAGAFTYYLQNSLGITHDVHTATGLTDADDTALMVLETGFYIANANGDGTYNVTLWVGSD